MQMLNNLVDTVQAASVALINLVASTPLINWITMDIPVLLFILYVFVFGYAVHVLYSRATHPKTINDLSDKEIAKLYSWNVFNEDPDASPFWNLRLFDCLTLHLAVLALIYQVREENKDFEEALEQLFECFDAVDQVGSKVWLRNSFRRLCFPKKKTPVRGISILEIGELYDGLKDREE